MMQGKVPPITLVDLLFGQSTIAGKGSFRFDMVEGENNALLEDLQSRRVGSRCPTCSVGVGELEPLGQLGEAVSVCLICRPLFSLRDSDNRDQSGGRLIWCACSEHDWLLI